jgi:hypothetical protein
MLYGLCAKHNYSNWILDAEDERYNSLHEGPRVKGAITTLEQWEEILSNKMMTIRRNHYHVRNSGMVVSLRTAVKEATTKLINLLGLGLHAADDTDGRVVDLATMTTHLEDNTDTVVSSIDSDVKQGQPKGWGGFKPVDCLTESARERFMSIMAGKTTRL